MANVVHETSTDRYLRAVAGRLRVRPDARVLNIACEEELVPSFLRGTVREENVQGVDLDDHVVDGKRVLRCNVDKEPLPFADGSFDVVVSVWGLEHFATDRVIREAARVLKPGGSLIFVTSNLSSPLFAVKQLLGGRFARWYYRRILRSRYEPHATHYRLNRISAVKRAAKNANLNIEQLTLLGPAHALYYLNFSHTAQRLATWFDRKVLTNRVLGWSKPYIVGALVKPA